jgi:hypothetical protein
MRSKDKDLRLEYLAEHIKSGVRGNYGKRYREGAQPSHYDRTFSELFLTLAAAHRALCEFAEKRKSSNKWLLHCHSLALDART